MPSKKFYFWRQYGGRKQLWPSVVLISLWLIMFTRLVHLQIIRGSYYLNRAERNRTHYSYVQAPRGNIYDRRGELIAGNRPNYSLYVSIEGLRAEQAREIAFKLDELTGRGRENILRRLAELRDKRGVSNILFRHLSREEIILIEENHHDIPRVFIQINPIRKYPFSEGLSHFLGYVGEISAGELRAKKKYAYMLKDIIGKTGIEAEYDLELRGQRGYRIMEVSVDGSHRKVLDEKKPVQGKHLVTTIDASLQEAAFKAMGDDRGAVVAMNPKTGEVLTWLSTPGFDPQEFTVTLSRERVRDLFENPLNPLFDRTIKGQFSPGSIFKTVVALAALTEDPDSFETEYTCRGKIEIGFDRREFKCWKEEGHGSVDMTEALAQSCNIYFYLTGLKTGHENILEMARQVGLGKKVQDILPGEKSGLLPSRDWKRMRFGEIWYPGDTANLSIGQGYILTTPMQLLRLTSVIASGGKIFKPYGVKMLVSPEGDKLKQFRPHPEKSLEIDPKALNVVKNALKEVIKDGTGSSMRFFGVPVEVAGKTGTSQNPFGEDHGWFAAFAPYENPEIAIVVLVEHGGSGAASALPVAAEVLREKFSPAGPS